MLQTPFNNTSPLRPPILQTVPQTIYSPPPPPVLPTAPQAIYSPPPIDTPQPAAKVPYQLDLAPYVVIGVKTVRDGPPHNPPDPSYRVACPSNRPYCIDYKNSDNGTCMYPDPLEIKRCYDLSCQNNSWDSLVYKSHGEHSYCKDFMTPAGRVCQWIDGVACTCPTKTILYYDGLFVAPGESMPAGFSQAFPCTYPLDIIRREAEEAALKSREKGKTGQPRRRRRARNGDQQDDGEQADEETYSEDGTKRTTTSANKKNFSKNAKRTLNKGLSKVLPLLMVVALLFG